LANEGLSIASSCCCVGLSPSNWYRVPDDWTVRDAEIIAALAGLVDSRPSRGFEYNEDRPHDALGDLTPMEARQQAAENSSFVLSH
jgi:hypothetical protein